MSTLIVTYVKKTTAQNEIGPGVLSSLLPLQQAAPILWPPDMKNWLIWKDCWCWERLKAGGEGEDRGWDGWMASPIQWTWGWVGSGSWWWTGKPGVLQTMGSQRVGHDWETELNWIYVLFNLLFFQIRTMLWVSSHVGIHSLFHSLSAV